MKKLYYLIFASIVSISLLSAGYAGYNASSSVKNRIDPLMSVVERQWWVESTIAQINKYQRIINSFSKITLSGEWKEMIWYLLYLFEKKVEKLEEEIVTQDELIGNVDWDEVQDAWVSWHNTERRNLGLKEYKIFSTLH